MNPLIPLVGHEPFDELKLEGEPDKKRIPSQWLQQTIIPTAASADPVAAPIERHSRHENDGILKHRVRNRCPTRRLKYAEPPRTKFVQRRDFQESGLVAGADLRIKHPLFPLESIQ